MMKGEFIKRLRRDEYTIVYTHTHIYLNPNELKLSFQNNLNPYELKIIFGTIIKLNNLFFNNFETSKFF